VFPSGSISDYIGSLERLDELRISAIWPGHGKGSDRPYEDIACAMARSRTLHEDTRMLFSTLETDGEFADIMASIATYAKRDS
jgi:glyoxylase-like metal-dependent hydrolase (beta-lactamase superfamily II)